MEEQYTIDDILFMSSMIRKIAKELLEGNVSANRFLKLMEILVQIARFMDEYANQYGHVFIDTEFI